MKEKEIERERNREGDREKDREIKKRHELGTDREQQTKLAVVFPGRLE